MTRAHKLLTSLIAVLTAGALGSLGCSGTNPAPPGTVASSTTAPARVRGAKPLHKTIRRSVTRPGQIEPFFKARLYAKIPAYVERILVDIGDEVKGPIHDADGNVTQPGQLLAVLSAPELDQELLQKKALLAQAGADVEQAQAAIAVAKAEVTNSKARLKEALATIERTEADYQRWSSQYDRMTQLVSRSVVNQKLADETKSQLAAADAGRKESQAKVDSARSIVDAAGAQFDKSMADEVAVRARRQVAEAEVARTLAMLGYLKIEAPFDGVVSERNADIGYFAQAGGGSQPQPLLTVVRMDRVRAFVDLAEMDAPLASVGDRATARVQSLSNREFPGEVTRTAWALDPNTRTLRTEVDLPNPDGELRPGMYVQLSIDLAESPNARVVPNSAVVAQDNRLWCFVIENGKAVRKEVAVGLKDGAETEIASGLNDDDLVIDVKGASIAHDQAVELDSTPQPAK